jgi:hypothetical protein
MTAPNIKPLTFQRRVAEMGSPESYIFLSVSRPLRLCVKMNP